MRHYKVFWQCLVTVRLVLFCAAAGQLQWCRLGPALLGELWIRRPGCKSVRGSRFCMRLVCIAHTSACFSRSRRSGPIHVCLKYFRSVKTRPRVGRTIACPPNDLGVRMAARSPVPRFTRDGTRLTSSLYLCSLCSRARKSAEHRIQAGRPGLRDQPRRAVDCAPYLNSASLRLCVKRATESWLSLREAFLCSGARPPWLQGSQGGSSVAGAFFALEGRAS